MKNFKFNGHSIPFTAGANISSGDVVESGGLIGVAQGDVANGEEGIMCITGVYELPKEAPLAISQGATLYWDVSEGVVTTTATDNNEIGKAYKAGLSADEVQLVLLKAGPASWN